MIRSRVLDRVWDVLMAGCLDEQTRGEYELAFEAIEDNWAAMNPKWITAQDLDELAELIEAFFCTFEMPSFTELTAEAGEHVAALAAEVCATAQYGAKSLARVLDPRPILRILIRLLTTELMPHLI